MFGAGKTYFSDSPVIIYISGLKWPASSPFNIVWIYVYYNGTEVGSFRAETGGQSSISFDISSALRAIWSDYDFSSDVAAAQSALTATSVKGQEASRNMREYTLRIFTEYLSSDDGGVFTTTQCVDADGNTDIHGGQCLIGWLTEFERSIIENEEDADVSHLEHTGVRNGDASTKPTSSPERIGKESITSWVDVQQGFTKTIFYPSDTPPAADDSPTSEEGWEGHAPLVLRDSDEYVDFLFVNRRGAIETCSGKMLESMNIKVETKRYSRLARNSFKPIRSLMNLRQSGPRRNWAMSSGYVDADWAEWWTMEFLTARQWWMRYQGPGQKESTYVPVVIDGAKDEVEIYDRTKQDMPHVDFTVTLALDG